MTSFEASFTGFVPESITGGIAAGQDGVDRYKSRFDMKRTTGNADQGNGDGNAADQRVPVPEVTALPRRSPARFVPDFYRDRRRPLGQQHTDTATAGVR